MGRSPQNLESSESRALDKRGRLREYDYTPGGYLGRAREGCRQTEMTRPKFIGAVLDGWPWERVLAMLVMGAVLLCHGALGASHQVNSYDSGAYDAPPALGHASQMDPQGAEEAGFAGIHGEEGLGNTAYLAALVSFSLGAFLWLLNGARVWGMSRAAMLPVRFLPRPALHPARGPRPAVLQVFRQ